MARKILITVKGEREDELAAHIVNEACSVLDAKGVFSSVESIKEREKEIQVPGFMYDPVRSKKMSKKCEKRRAKYARERKRA